ncbi:YceI family protein [Flavobacterium haoranii]|uniref:Polyisoprenoid-binding protein YceI n=1 Tax=Flavobacterium haoranii TaxID=683124 RepID=A0A1M6J053_9FLAO|nr:YceI family protein [Flavobacterium haoranii]SHJ40115.1 Polyisoprenoid-binding protein YceI [Flavobacterium haoranii]
MKKNGLFALVAAGLILASCGGKSTETTTSAEQEVAATTENVFAVDTTASVVKWKAFHKGGFAPRWGTLSIQNGEISVLGDAVNAGSFVIDMQSLKVDPASVTEEGKKATDLEAHLKNADFFDVENNKTAEFKITKVEDLAAPLAEGEGVKDANKMLSGNLTLLGNTLNVSFPAKIDVVDNTVTILADFTVNRAEWGIKFGTTEADPAEWMISKDIEISVDVKATK